MESTSKMLLSLEKLMNHKIGGAKPPRKSVGKLQNFSTHMLGINRTPSHKSRYNTNQRMVFQSTPVAMRSSYNDIEDDILTSFKSLVLAQKRKPSAKKSTAKKSAAKKSAPHRRPIKMQEDQSDEDLLVSMLSKPSSSISQKSRSIASKNIKNSKLKVEKKIREATRRATATRSSSRISKKPPVFNPNAKNNKKKSPKKRLSAIAE